MECRYAYMLYLGERIGEFLIWLLLFFKGDSVSKIESQNQFTDRKWKFDCRPSNLNLVTTDACSLIETSQQSLEDIHYMCKGRNNLR